MKIPSKFNVGGQEINVKVVDSLDGKLGNVCVGSGWLNIANNFNGNAQSDSSKFNTFYHELVHTILDTMGKDDLAQDEVFVSSFSGFLSEAIKSMEYND